MITLWVDRELYRSLRMYAAGVDSNPTRVIRALVRRVVVDGELGETVARDLEAGRGRPRGS